MSQTRVILGVILLTFNSLCLVVCLGLISAEWKGRVSQGVLFCLARETLAVCDIWTVAVAAVQGGIEQVRNLTVVMLLLPVPLFVLCLWWLPDTRSHQKYELVTVASPCAAFVILTGLVLNIAPDQLSAETGNQCIFIVAASMQLVVSFVVAPKWARRTHEQLMMDTTSPNGSSSSPPSSAKERVFAVMSDVQSLGSFMQYCCQNWSAENLLCLLELSELKRNLRKKVKRLQARGVRMSSQESAPIGHSSRKSESNATFGTSNTAFSDSADLSAKLAEHSALMNEARQTEHFPQSAFFDESLCSWDLHCKVSLSQLGCQSSIVSNKDRTLSDKARLLCEKYFEYTSQYCVNVSESSRRVILSLVGEHSTVADSLDSLVFLFLFDEAVKDLIDNLNDSLLRFQFENSVKQ